MIDPLLPLGDGQTEISDEDRQGLIPTYISTRGELWDAEEAAIAKATFGLTARVADFADDFTTTDMVNSRNHHTATVLRDGRVLAAAGVGTDRPDIAGNNRALRSAELYDPPTGRWATTGSLVERRSGHTASLLPDGRVLVAGGRQDTVATLATMEIYDPNTVVWSSPPGLSLQVARADHTATVLSDGRVLFAGGRDGQAAPIAVSELYDPRDNTVTTADTGIPRWGHTATLIAGDKVVVAGGYGAASRSVQVFDPATGAWSTKADMPTDRVRHAAVPLSATGKILVVGGFDSTSRTPLASVEMYDPAADSWAQRAPMATPRDNHSAIAMPDGRVLAVGGQQGSTRFGEVYQERENRWTPTTCVVGGGSCRARQNGSASVLATGKVLVAGGCCTSVNTESFATAVLFDPSATPVLALAPTTGPQDGGTEVVITGRNFGAVTGVRFGSQPTSFVVDSTTQITAVAPAQSSAGPADVVLQSAAGPSATGPETRFSYIQRSGDWLQTDGMFTRRTLHTATHLDGPECRAPSPPPHCGQVLVVGGRAGNAPPIPLARQSLYDPLSGQWSGTCAAGTEVCPAPMATPRINHTATLLRGPNCGSVCGHVLVVGGLDDKGTTEASLASAELFDPATGSWVNAGSMTDGRSTHTATLLSDGGVLVAGGRRAETEYERHIRFPAGTGPAVGGDIPADLRDLEGGEPPERGPPASHRHSGGRWQGSHDGRPRSGHRRDEQRGALRPCRVGHCRRSQWSSVLPHGDPAPERQGPRCRRCQ